MVSARERISRSAGEARGCVNVDSAQLGQWHQYQSHAYRARESGARERGRRGEDEKGESFIIT